MNITSNIRINNDFINEDQPDINLKIFSEAILSILENEISIPAYISSNPNNLWNSENTHLFDNIRELDLRDLELTAIPSQIGLLRNLKDLDLSNNQILTLPAEMKQLSELVHLSLNNTSLFSIPDVIYELTNLHGLYLSDNQISQLDQKITNLKNLKWLYLNNNPINQIPSEAISFFGTLKTVSLGNNFSQRMLNSNLLNLNLMDKFI